MCESALAGFPMALMEGLLALICLSCVCIAQADSGSLQGWMCMWSLPLPWLMSWPAQTPLQWSQCCTILHHISRASAWLCDPQLPLPWPHQHAAFTQHVNDM